MSKKYYCINRCNYCNKFRKWENLKSINFIPDSDYSVEEWEMICSFCEEKRPKLKPIYSSYNKIKELVKMLGFK